MRGLIIMMLVSAAAIVSLNACRPGHSIEHIRAVDSLLTVVKAEELAIDQLDSAALAAASDSVQQQLSFIQANYTSLLPSGLADQLDRYAQTGKMAKQPLSVLEKLRSSASTQEKQLVALKEALEKGATHDAQGQELTKEYVALQLEKEKQQVLRIQQERDHWQVAASAILQKWNDLYPSIHFMVDSLKKVN
ncbi:MAG: hypothetical protein RLZZ77_1996 [Bacteroidota bacterium]|jgi:hypothetical protein